LQDVLRIDFLTEEGKIWELLEMCFYGHLDQVKLLLSQGVDVNAVGPDGLTPLHAATQGQNIEIIEYLISVGAKD
jgi:ankyrin repeat protein